MPNGFFCFIIGIVVTASVQSLGGSFLAGFLVTLAVITLLAAINEMIKEATDKIIAAHTATRPAPAAQQVGDLPAFGRPTVS